MQKRNRTAAVIGAGDFIGGEIAKKFASEGFTVFAGRRNGDKLAPLVKDIEAAGGEIHARSLDARKEEEITAFLSDADKHAPLEVCIFNIGANVNSRSSRRPSGCSARSGRWRATPAFSPAARPRG
ncbi:short-subunit dehydrogenase [Bradyrhizobium diazoefficiens]